MIESRELQAYLARVFRGPGGGGGPRRGRAPAVRPGPAPARGGLRPRVPGGPRLGRAVGARRIQRAAAPRQELGRRVRARGRRAGLGRRLGGILPARREGRGNAVLARSGTRLFGEEAI